MGNDGGSIPSRRELVRSPTKTQTHSQARESALQTSSYRWSYCPLSKRPLQSPIVSDHLGYLYNMDSALEWLIKGVEAFGDGEEVTKGRLKSRRDFVRVLFEEEKEEGVRGGEEGQRSGEVDETRVRGEKWRCPVSRKELGPGVRACYLVPCGHAFAESAIKEVGGGTCLVCNEPYDPTDIITINPTDEADITRLTARITSLHSKKKSHSLKKLPKDQQPSKKRKSSSSDDPTTTTPKPDSEPPTKKHQKSLPKINNAATANLTAAVMKEERERDAKRKSEMSDNLKSLYSKKGGSGIGGGDFLGTAQSRGGAKR